jgi:hypothetical protein
MHRGLSDISLRMKCDYRRGFGLMIEFIGLFDTARDYTL